MNASLWGYVYLLMSFAMSWWGRRMLAADIKRLRLRCADVVELSTLECEHMCTHTNARQDTHSSAE